MVQSLGARIGIGCGVEIGFDFDKECGVGTGVKSLGVRIDTGFGVEIGFEFGEGFGVERIRVGMGFRVESLGCTQCSSSWRARCTRAAPPSPRSASTWGSPRRSPSAPGIAFRGYDWHTGLGLVSFVV